MVQTPAGLGSLLWLGHFCGGSQKLSSGSHAAVSIVAAKHRVQDSKRRQPTPFYNVKSADQILGQGPGEECLHGGRHSGGY